MRTIPTGTTVTSNQQRNYLPPPEQLKVINHLRTPSSLLNGYGRTPLNLNALTANEIVSIFNDYDLNLRNGTRHISFKASTGEELSQILTTLAEHPSPQGSRVPLTIHIDYLGDMNDIKISDDLRLPTNLKQIIFEDNNDLTSVTRYIRSANRGDHDGVHAHGSNNKGSGTITELERQLVEKIILNQTSSSLIYQPSFYYAKSLTETSFAEVREHLARSPQASPTSTAINSANVVNISTASKDLILTTPPSRPTRPTTIPQPTPAPSGANSMPANVLTARTRMATGHQATALPQITGARINELNLPTYINDPTSQNISKPVFIDLHPGTVIALLKEGLIPATVKSININIPNGDQLVEITQLIKALNPNIEINLTPQGLSPDQQEARLIDISEKFTGNSPLATQICNHVAENISSERKATLRADSTSFNELINNNGHLQIIDVNALKVVNKPQTAAPVTASALISTEPCNNIQQLIDSLQDISNRHNVSLQGSNFDLIWDKLVGNNGASVGELKSIGLISFITTAPGTKDSITDDHMIGVEHSSGSFNLVFKPKVGTTNTGDAALSPGEFIIFDIDQSKLSPKSAAGTAVPPQATTPPSPVISTSGYTNVKNLEQELMQLTGANSITPSQAALATWATMRKRGISVQTLIDHGMTPILGGGQALQADDRIIVKPDGSFGLQTAQGTQIVFVSPPAIAIQIDKDKLTKESPKPND